MGGPGFSRNFVDFRGFGQFLGPVCADLKPPQRSEQVRLESILAPFLVVLRTGLERSQTSTASGADPFGVDLGSFFARSGDTRSERGCKNSPKSDESAPPADPNESCTRSERAPKTAPKVTKMHRPRTIARAVRAQNGPRKQSPKRRKCTARGPIESN